MLKKIQYFLPSLPECWILVFVLIAIGGIGTGIVIYPLEAIFDVRLSKLLPPVTYLLPMVPAFIYLYHRGKAAQAEQPQGDGVPLDKGNIGKMNLFFFVLASFLVLVAVTVLTDPLSSLLPMPDSMKKIFEEMMQMTPLSILTVVVLAPLAEEFFLRGVMARGLFFHTTPAKAIAWSAFLFAIIHLNPWQAVPAFLVGLFLGWIYWRTHSLLACIFIHFANNGAASLVTVLFPDMQADTSLQELLAPSGEHIFVIAYIASVFVLSGALYYFNKNLPAPGVVWRAYKKTHR